MERLLLAHQVSPQFSAAANALEALDYSEQHERQKSLAVPRNSSSSPSAS